MALAHDSHMLPLHMCVRGQGRQTGCHALVIRHVSLMARVPLANARRTGPRCGPQRGRHVRSHHATQYLMSHTRCSMHCYDVGQLAPHTKPSTKGHAIKNPNLIQSFPTPLPRASAYLLQ